jgi:hypothetical protein
MLLQISYAKFCCTKTISEIELFYDQLSISHCEPRITYSVNPLCFILSAFVNKAIPFFIFLKLLFVCVITYQGPVF